MSNLNSDQFGDYQTGHRPGDTGDEFGYFHEADKAYPDIYEKPHLYTSKYIPGDSISMAHIKRARGKPDADVTIHRAVPPHVNQINPGDWVTAAKPYAQQHIESNGKPDWHILSQTVKARDLTHSTDAISELGYFPKKAPGGH